MANQLAAYSAADAAIAGPVIYSLALGSNIGAIDPGASIDFDYGIAGIGFLSAANDQSPYQRGLANILKDQVNNSEQPGDQSFTNWWLRSQTDWSSGAGTSNMEPITDAKVQSSFYSSYGVDVWTPGQVSLLPAMEKQLDFTVDATGGSHLLALYNGYYIGVDEEAHFINSSFTATAVTGLTSGEKVTSLATGNGQVYICTDTSVYSVTSGSTSATKYFTFPEVDENARAFFAKDRLILTSKGAIWDQAPPESGDPLTTLAYVDALYRKPANHAWVSVVTAPSFILIAGSCQCNSEIYSISLDTTGALPVLGAPTVVAEFPNNEIVTHMGSYLGAYLAIATTLGVRIGTMSANGISYGARLEAPVASGPFSAYDRFLYYPTTDAGEERTGVVRIDLSNIDDTSRAAWANDVRVPVSTSGECDGVAISSSGEIVFTNNKSTSIEVYSTSADFEEIGFISTPDVRLGTTEKKYFDGINVQLDPAWQGTVTVTAQTDDGSVGLVGAFTEASGNDVELKVSQVEPASKIALGFTLKASDDLAYSPIIQSWQLRALPAVQRQRLIKVPLLCFDHERDSRGTPYGYEGYAVARWRTLEENSRQGWPFTFQDLHTNETYRVVLESVSFTQTSPPTNASGFGGVVDLTVRVIS